MLRRPFAAITLALALAAPVTLEMPATAAPAHEGSTFSPVIQGSAPAWVLQPVRGNGDDLNFAKGEYYLKGSNGVMPANTRATNETCWTSTGNLVQVGPYQNCVTDLGVGAWEGRTNTIYDSAFVGGSAGVWAPHCSYYWPVGQAPATITPSAPYVLNGMPVIDIVIAGTPSGAGTISFGCAVNTDAQAAAGQTWAITEYLMLKSGSLAGTSGWATFAVQWNAALNQTNIVAGNSVNASAGPSGVMTNYGTVKTLVNVAAGVPTAYVASYFQFNVTTSPLNFTLTMGYHGQELNPTLPASVASAATAANGAGGVNGSAVYSVVGGTGTPATLNVTWAAGVLTVNSVASAGSYSAATGLPASPATLAYVSGTATGWTGATVNLTPVGNSAQGFATTPILTSSGALARAPDSITMPVANCQNPSLYVVGTPAAPTGSAVIQVAAEIGDGSYNNRLVIYRTKISGNPVASTTSGGVGIAVTPASTWVQNTPGKLSMAQTSTVLSGSFNNGSVATTASPAPTVNLTKMGIGNQYLGFAPWNGTISRVAVSCGQSLLLSEAPANDNDMFAANDNVPWLKVVGVF